MVDFEAVSSLATAGGTLVLAVVTVAAVRSANRSARIAERSMLAGMRPLLLPSRLQDPDQKVGFADNHWVRIAGGHASAEALPEAVYLTLSLRNAGAGLALLHGWSVVRQSSPASDVEPTDIEDFRRLSRDLYVAGGDMGFWQGAVRDRQDAADGWLRERIAARERIVVDLLYGDQEGSQRVISRFALTPAGATADWLAVSARHWYPDRDAPR